MASVHLVLVPGSRAARDLSVGGVFVNDCPLSINASCQLVVEAAGRKLALAARVVYVDGSGGAGLEVLDFSPECKAVLAELVAAAEAAPPEPTQRIDTIDPAELADDSPLELDLGPLTEPMDLGGLEEQIEDAFEPPGDDAQPETRSQHERLRGLTLAEQQKRAHAGDTSERIMLERMYGKNVWEALLRNPRLTAPEVARIARMGTLPRPQLEVIISNGGWLQIPEVRRALLANPRLGSDQIQRVLKLMPKHELKVAATQTAYPHAVRDAAKRLVK